jgi:hypothetical protein
VPSQGLLALSGRGHGFGERALDLFDDLYPGGRKHRS